MRAVFHAWRHVGAANLNERVTDAVRLHSAVPTTALLATPRSLLGSSFVSQVALWYGVELGLPLNSGMKAFLRAA